MGHLGRATCTLQSFSAQASQEGIECTKRNKHEQVVQLPQPRNNRKKYSAETKLPGAAYSVHGNFILPSTIHKEAICPTNYRLLWLRVYCPNIYAVG